LAVYIASVVPVYEYFHNPALLPRPSELRITDWRQSKRLLAVQAHDIECVVEMLNHPDHALQIRSKVLRSASAKIRRSSQAARREAVRLRATARHARLKAAQVPEARAAARRRRARSRPPRE
jgi:hypothetical protein